MGVIGYEGKIFNSCSGVREINGLLRWTRQFFFVVIANDVGPPIPIVQ